MEERLNLFGSRIERAKSEAKEREREVEAEEEARKKAGMDTIREEEAERRRFVA